MFKITLTKSDTVIHEMKIPKNTVLFLYENGNCAFVKQLPNKNRKAILLCYSCNKWEFKKANRKLSDYIHAFWKSHKPKTHTLTGSSKYEEYMKHDRVHKKGSGSRIGHSGIVTDYECTKYPLHDFPRSRWVNWNQ